MNALLPIVFMIAAQCQGTQCYQYQQSYQGPFRSWSSSGSYTTNIDPNNFQCVVVVEGGNSRGSGVLLVLASLVGAGAGVGVPWSLGMFEKPAAVESAFDDTASNVEAVQLWQPEQQPQ